MTVTEMQQQVEFVVDSQGQKKAVLVDFSLWEELLTRLEDLEDAAEVQNLREGDQEVIPWRQAKEELRAEGVDV